MSVLQYINLGLDLLVLIALVFCLLRGFIIGFNKSTRRVISIVVPFVLLAIFLGSIAVKILEEELKVFFKVTEKIKNNIINMNEK